MCKIYALRSKVYIHAPRGTLYRLWFIITSSRYYLNLHKETKRLPPVAVLGASPRGLFPLRQEVTCRNFNPGSS